MCYSKHRLSSCSSRHGSKAGIAYAAIENMRQWLGFSNSHNANGPQKSNGDSLASGAFFGMSIPDAIEKFLAFSKGKRNTNEVVEALERGGMTHSSKNFKNTVSTALYREDAKADAHIVKVAEGEWGLVDWYAGLKAKRAKRSGEDRVIEVLRESLPHSEPEEEFGGDITDDGVPL